MPREMFPVASMLVSAYHTVPSLVILAIACFATGWEPDTVGLLAGLLGFTIITVLGTALALLFSAANVFFRDFQNIVGTLTSFVHFSVPMIYPFSMVEERFGSGVVELWLANPLAEAVLLIQRCFWVGTTTDETQTIREGMPHDLYVRGFTMLMICFVLLGMAQLIFARLENKFPERL
jgi:ABC-2 type transport system permease protein